jgi:hypothetical protein
MSNINKVEWEKIIKQGLLLYLVLHWILLAALPAAIILTTFRWLIQDRSMEFFSSGIFINRIIVSFVLCSVLGVILGLKKWFKSKKFYSDS